MSFAGKTGRDIEHKDLPSNWQPVLSFYQAGEPEGSGVLFVEVETEDNRGVARIKLIHLVFDKKDKKDGHSIYRETDVLNLSELTAKGGYPMIVKSGYQVINLKALEASDQGARVRIRLLSDATNIVQDKYNDELQFKVAVVGTKVVATRGGKDFNLLGMVQRKAWVPGSGTIAVGIEKVMFCHYSCNSPVSDFAP